MTKVIQILLLTCIFNNTIATAQTAEEVLQSAYETINNHTSISYDLLFKSKKFWSTDTTEVFQASCNILKTEDNQGYFWYHYDISSFSAANGNSAGYSSIERISKLAPLLESFENSEVLLETATLRPSLSQGNYLHHYFLNPKQLLAYKNIELKSIEWGKKPYHHITITLPENVSKKARIVQLWIDKTTFHIHRIFNNFEYNGMEGVHHDEWNISNISVDTLKKSTILEREEKIKLLRMMHDYERVKNYDYSNIPDGQRSRFYYNNNPLLKAGKAVPNFEGWNFVENRTVNSSEFLGSPTLLCFWSPYRLGYERMDSTIAFLNELQKVLASEVIVLGLVQGNEVTTSEYLYDLVEYNKMQFQNLAIDHNINDIFGTIGYPEMYLIDENGTIVKSFVGFHDSYKIAILEALKK